VVVGTTENKENRYNIKLDNLDPFALCIINGINVSKNNQDTNIEPEVGFD
jgi:hypothetical protein